MFQRMIIAVATNLRKPAHPAHLKHDDDIVKLTFMGGPMNSLCKFRQSCKRAFRLVQTPFVSIVKTEHGIEWKIR